MIDKKGLLEAEILRLDDLIRNVNKNNGYCFDDYNKDVSENITLEYIDAYDYEKITIEPIIFNEYGIIKYIISVESYCLSDELELDNLYYCAEIPITESKLKRVEAKTEKTRNKYLEAKPITLNAWPEKLITVENMISNRECFLNVTHFHYYYSKNVTLETRDFSDISAFLQLRDFFRNIKMGDK